MHLRLWSVTYSKMLKSIIGCKPANRTGAILTNMTPCRFKSPRIDCVAFGPDNHLGGLYAISAARAYPADNIFDIKKLFRFDYNI